ncbi:MAG: CoA ester lyase [Gammaproteobacteria bacterium]|jgi:citrate lyase subunit beta/citryl-CoA lyase|nr:CoA ester lyase [Gammaproteobacteria bacterium]
MQSESVQLRRSILFMPASNERALAKGRTLAADALVFDLEDAVAPEQKSAARDNAVTAAATGEYGHREIILRVNDPASEWGLADLQAAASGSFAGVMLPKVESGKTIREARAALIRANSQAALPLWIMVETPRGVLALDDILGAATAEPGSGPLVVGTTDLASALGVSPLGDRRGLQHALGQCVLAARAHGLDIIDGVYLTLRDESGFAATCAQGRELGFTGKSLIHPSQIAAANAAFGVSESEAEQAREIIAAWEAARAEGSGLAVVSGQLVEVMHVDNARRTLLRYAAANN